MQVIDLPEAIKSGRFHFCSFLTEGIQLEKNACIWNTTV